MERLFTLTSTSMTTSPDKLRADCDKCGERLWRMRRGEWSLANRIVKLAKGGLVAKCPGCGNEVRVPFLQFVEPVELPVREGGRLVVHIDRLDKPH